MDIKVNSKEENNEYNFPFPPYDIQLKLMKEAYDTYETSKFAILESPTGTGKSLSLICSSLTWLRNHQNKVKHELEDKKVELTERAEELKREEEISGDWLSLQTKRQDVTKELAEINVQLEKINKFEEKNEARRHAKLHHVPLEIYSSMRGNKGDMKRDSGAKDENKLLGFDESTLEEEEEDIEQNLKDTNEVDTVRPKIYYASRTHSQLSQFINEIKRTKFADFNQGCTVKVAPMASRANMCVNPDVLRLKDPNAINERCLEMQRETMVDKRCSFMKGKQVRKLKEDILSSVQDIEDIVSRGRVMGSCPYYASRMSVPEAEVVVLPYNNLLHHETRKASSLDLKENIVIIDEAHNILETICSIHSATIAGQHLIGTHTVLSRYYKRYHNRMSPKNASTIKTIVECITAIIKFLNDPKRHLKDYECPKQIMIEDEDGPNLANEINTSGGGKASSKHEEFMVDVVKFMGAANLDRFNVFKLVDYFNRSQLARKLLGFYRQDNLFELELELKGIERKDGEVEEDTPIKKKRKLQCKQVPSTNTGSSLAGSDQESTSLSFLKTSNPILAKRESVMTSYPVYILVEFLRSLTNLTHDGKILIDRIEGDIQRSILKFILLNPSSQFKQMVEDTRSIVLAGGTMQPFNEFTDLLFEPLKIDKERLTLFSCDHVVAPEQLFVASLSTGSTGKPLELSYRTRNNFEAIDEFGRTISIISDIVPGGMVCFFPSYDYEQIYFNRWKQIGVIANIETKSKQVFREPRQTSHLKPVLEEYCRVIEKGKSCKRGAMLMCVVGGKMSEGINFNDDLGRCIVMVGLPYANIKSSELQQKMSYYDRTCKRSPGASATNSAGQQYYENLCTKGINQSIGRAIRHRTDYASIILLDRRYATKTTIKDGLPGWMRKSLGDFPRFGPMADQLRAFFANFNTLCQQQ